MRVGAFHFPTDYGIEISELARALEARGFESLFVCEHTHIPVSRRSPYPGGGELPKRYCVRATRSFARCSLPYIPSSPFASNGRQAGATCPWLRRSSLSA